MTSFCSFSWLKKLLLVCLGGHCLHFHWRVDSSFWFFKLSGFCLVSGFHKTFRFRLKFPKPFGFDFVPSCWHYSSIPPRNELFLRSGGAILNTCGGGPDWNYIRYLFWYGFFNVLSFLNSFFQQFWAISCLGHHHSQSPTSLAMPL